LKLYHNIIQTGGKNDIIFLFFNGGGLSHEQWITHPYYDDEWLNRPNENKKSDLIRKIKQFGDVYLYTPIFNITYEDMINGKMFSIKDLNLENHVKKLNENIKDYKKVFIISHSRGNILAKFFCSIYNYKVIGYINIDGGESSDWYNKYFYELDDKYKDINDEKLNELFRN